MEANFPVDKAGNTYHVGTRHGQVANRIITVGDPHRAQVIAQFLDCIYFEFTSKRGFLTITGAYKGIPVSIIAIGMGSAMMDFFVRETRHVVEGDLVIFRFGSCGAINNATSGNIVVATESTFIYKNYGAYYSNKMPYQFAPLVTADKECVTVLYNELKSKLSHVDTHKGLCGTADSFYSSQGRLGVYFDDKNESVVSDLLTLYPTAEILEMEVYPLYHLSDISTTKSIRCVAGAMVFADRQRNTFLPLEKSKVLEKEAGKCFLDAIIQIKIKNEHKKDAVWVK